MIVNLVGTQRRYDIQSLCLLFFPLENFSEDTGKTLSVSFENNIARATLEYKKLKYSNEVFLENVYDAERFTIKKCVYSVLQKATGIFPPWGILTGIKPALFYEKLKTEYGENAHDVFKTDYYVTQKKIDLCENVLEQRRLPLTLRKEGDVGLYISIPFCPSRCRYCSFVSSSTSDEGRFLAPYLEKIQTEIKSKKKLLEKVNTIYIGGGTPTVLTASQLKTLLKVIESNIDVSYVKEYTVEAGRPDTITTEKLDVMNSFGVSRISVNPQTLNDEVLTQIGRKHTANDFFDAYGLAKNKFDINVDLIAGLPKDSLNSFVDTFAQIIDLAPENITLHTLYVKKGSDIRYDNTDVLDSEYETIKMVDAAQYLCLNSGYYPYYMYRQKNTVGNCENVGYSKKGKQCLYNIYMMDDVQTIIGVGANATTKIIAENNQQKRYCNTKYAYNYLKEPQYEIKR